MKNIARRNEDPEKRERGNYRFYFILGAIGTLLISDPFYPLVIRILFLIGLALATALNVTRVILRLAGREAFAKYEPLISGSTDGISIVVLIFVILAFYFRVNVPIISIS